MSAWWEEHLVECLGWALVHSLWQGFAAAALLAMALRVMREATSNTRYVAACAAMFMMTIAPVITFERVAAHYRMDENSAVEISHAPISSNIPTAMESLPGQIFKNKWIVKNTSLRQRLEMALPWLVVAWFAGVVIFSLRLLGGWLQITRLRRTAVTALADVWHSKLRELERRVGIRRAVRIWESAVVEVPTVIGWLRPIILMPASCLVGLTPEQLESILAHELAHIRRHDYLVNVLQTMIETVLFYHPAVWWTSRQIRAERENCCDDLAVAICGDRINYARALATLEELRQTPGQLSLAAGGAPLLQRVQRLLGRPAKPATATGWPIAGLIVLLLVAAVAVGAHGNRAVAEEQKTETVGNTIPADSHGVSSPLVTNRSADNESPKLETRQFHVNPQTFSQGVEVVSGIQFDSDEATHGAVAPGLKFNNSDPKTTRTAQAFRTFLAMSGVDLDTNNPANTGKAFAWNDRKGILLLRARPEELDSVESAIMKYGWSANDTNTNSAVVVTRAKAWMVNTNLPGSPVTIAQNGAASFDYNWVFNGSVTNAQASDGTGTRLNEIVARVQSDPTLVQSESNQVGIRLNEIVARAQSDPTRGASADAQVGSNGTGIRLNEIVARVLPDINIKVKIFELDEARLSKKDFDWIWSGLVTSNNAGGLPKTQGFSTATNSIRAQSSAQMSEQQAAVRLQELKHSDGVVELTAPEVTTLSGRQAQIQVSSPITVVTGATRDETNHSVHYTTEQKNFGCTVDVTPFVTSDRKSVHLKLTQSITTFLGYASTNLLEPGLGQTPSYQKPLPEYGLRQLSTESTVADAQTLVIGGIDSGYSETVTNKVPVLGSIPGLGRLFRKTRTTEIKKDVLIFVTPTLINADGTRWNKDEASESH